MAFSDEAPAPESRPEIGQSPVHDPFNLPPPDIYDPVIEAYKKDVDRTLLRENLKLSVKDRIRRFQSFLDSLDEWRGAANRRQTNSQ